MTIINVLSKLNICPLDYKNKWALGMILSFLFVICLTIGGLFYNVILATPYLTYPELPFQAIPPNTTIAEFSKEKSKRVAVKQGEIIPLIVNKCNRDNISHAYNVSHSLMEINRNEITPLPPVSTLVKPGCNTSISRINRTPQDLPAGTYKVFGYAEIKGTVKTFSVDWESTAFDVIEVVKPNPVTIINNNAAPMANKSRYIIIETKKSK